MLQQFTHSFVPAYQTHSAYSVHASLFIYVHGFQYWADIVLLANVFMYSMHLRMHPLFKPEVCSRFSPQYRQEIRRLIPVKDEAAARKKTLWKTVFEGFDRIDGIPTQQEREVEHLLQYVRMC